MPASLDGIVVLGAEVALHLVNLLVLIVLVTNIRRTFNSAFYHIFLGVQAADILYFVIVSVFGNRLPVFGVWRPFYEQNGWVAAWVYHCSGVFGFMQFVGHTLITMNRVSMLCFPLRHNSFWAHKWYLLLLILLPVAIVGPRFWYPGRYTYFEDGSPVLGHITPEQNAVASMEGIVVYIVSTVFCFFLNLIAAWRYHQLRVTNQLKDFSAHELNLCLFAVVFFVVQLARTTYVLLRSVFITDKNILYWLHYLLPVISDLDAWLGTVSLLFFSSVARQACIRFYGLESVVARFSRFFDIKQPWTVAAASSTHTHT